MEDVVRGSPFEPVAPLYAGMLGEGDNHLTFRLTNKDSIKKSMKIIGPIFKKFDPENAFGYELVSDRYFGNNFRSIELTGKLARLFTSLAVFLTALGILGLASYTAERRTKELSTRKVLGAATEQLVILLSGYFIRVASLALLIAVPLSWWSLNRYLENYSYRISIPWWIAPAAGVIILAMTLVIVGTQVVKAALANPVKGLGSDT